MERACGIPLAQQNRWRERHTRPRSFLAEDPLLKEALEGLASRFVVVLGTNNAPGVTHEILRALAIPAALFEGIYTSEDLGAAKPDPAFFAGILRVTGAGPSEIVSVGDRPASDLDPAARMGMATYLVRTVDDVYRLRDAAAR
jgi:FMN phosphatase YigB (HAD superfamily)